MPDLKTALGKLFSFGKKNKSAAIGGKQEGYGRRTGEKRASADPAVKGYVGNRISGGTQRTAKGVKVPCPPDAYWDEEQQKCIKIKPKDKEAVRFTKMKTAQEGQPDVQETDIEHTEVGIPETINKNPNMVTKFRLKKGRKGY